MSDEQIFTPEEAVEYLQKKRGLVYSVSSLRMRRYRKQISSKNIKKRTTLWTKGELDAIEPTSWTKRVPIEDEEGEDGAGSSSVMLMTSYHRLVGVA